MVSQERSAVVAFLYSSIRQTGFSSLAHLYRGILTAFGVSLLAACSSAPSRAPFLPPGVTRAQSASISEPVSLRVKAVVGSTETVRYLHRSASVTSTEGNPQNREEQTLKFTADAETLKVEPMGSLEKLYQVIKVRDKKGELSLHDFAMPDPGEKLEITADSLGRVFQAGDWPPDSIFYVPSVSLPDRPVRVGDTWAMNSSWRSLEDNVTYRMSMASILKGLVACGAETCADIEVSGQVTLPGTLENRILFRSEWSGRMWFSIERGSVLWSRLASEESLRADRAERMVRSCLEAVAVDRKIFKNDETPECRGFQNFSVSALSQK